MPPIPQSPLRPLAAIPPAYRSRAAKLLLFALLTAVTFGVITGSTDGSPTTVRPYVTIGTNPTQKAVTQLKSVPPTNNSAQAEKDDKVRRIGIIVDSPSAVNGITVDEAFIIERGVSNGSVDQKPSEMSRFRLTDFHMEMQNDVEIGIRILSDDKAAGTVLLYPAFNPTKGRSQPLTDNKYEDADAATLAPHLASHCPRDRFITVNTHTWGRHHNQLQEIMNTITWAQRLNRTAIISYFRYSHAWHPADMFYDFTEIKKRYCVVSHKEAEAILSHRANTQKLPMLTSRCLGQGIKGTKFKHLAGIARCPGKLDLPAHYNARFSVRITKTMVKDYVLTCTEGFLILSGQIAFYMRSGLWNNAMIFRHLRPSPLVRAAVNSEMLQRFFDFEEANGDSNRKKAALPFDESKNSFQNDPVQVAQVAKTIEKFALGDALKHFFPSDASRGFSVYPYFSIHSRSREVDCLLEMSYDESDNEGFLSSMGGDSSQDTDQVANKSRLLAGSSATWRTARGQCRISTELVDKIINTTNPRKGTKLFLASDGQNADLEAAMASRGAIKVNNKFGGNALMAMAVDFFLMTQGLYFTGNQLSSVSQNVCFVRLGNGLTCDGWYPIWTLYHARDALSRTIPDPPKAIR